MGHGASISNSVGYLTSNYATVNRVNLECSLCLNVFVDPRILPCGHTFCLQCIVRQNTCSSSETCFSCAMCRQVYTVPNGDVSKLSKNHSLAQMIPDTRPETSTSAAAKDSKFLCKTHTDQKLIVYCEECRMFICTLCSLFLHSGHTCIETTHADCEFKKVINDAAKKCQAIIATHRQQISKFERKLYVEKSNLDKVERQLAQYELLVSPSVSFIEREVAARNIQYDDAYDYGDDHNESDYDEGGGGG
jgi:hypothetical protein